MIYPKKQKMNKIIDKVGLHLHERRERQTLAKETQKAINEINFIEQKISKVSRSLHETVLAVNALEPHVIESKSRLEA